MQKPRRYWLFAIPLLIAVITATIGSSGSAQTPEAASPAASPMPTSEGISLVAGGLINPRGFAWSPDGDLYVSLAGNGITSMGQVPNPKDYQYGPYIGDNTASVVRIEGSDGAIGCPVAVAGGLPSTHGMGGNDQGPADVAFLDGKMYVLQDAGDDAIKEAPDRPNGVYLANDDGSLTLLLDMATWHKEHPVAHIPYDLGEESETFALLAGDGFLWLLESNSGQVLKVTTDGAATRVADLSEGHPVPTGFALSPDGGVYVGFLTSAPYTDGSSKVVKVMPDGTVTDVWTGLTMVTALAVGTDGTLYALEMATGNIDKPPYTLPNTGRIVRQTGPDSLAEVVTGLDVPIAMKMGPDQALYVAFPTFGADPPIGGILRVDLTAPQPMTVSSDILALDTCEIEMPSEAPPNGGMGDMMASPAGGGMMASPMSGGMMATPGSGGMMATPETTPLASGEKTETGAVAIIIKNFAFSPATVEVPAGTVITFDNQDTTAHTATSTDGAFDSGNLNPGESYSITLDKPGTYTYTCTYHPNMKGTIIVK
jgi:plastocyanin/sugar lactone lactonase YvrE